MTVGYFAAMVSVIMVPDADQVNTSICPGVSTNTKLHQEGGRGRGSQTAHNLPVNATVNEAHKSAYRAATTTPLTLDVL